LAAHLHGFHLLNNKRFKIFIVDELIILIKPISSSKNPIRIIIVVFWIIGGQHQPKYRPTFQKIWVRRSPLYDPELKWEARRTFEFDMKAIAVAVINLRSTW
jgi:hypothetical protein